MRLDFTTPLIGKAHSPGSSRTPTSVLFWVVVGLILARPFLSTIIMACSWAAWLACSLALWECAKEKALPKENAAYAKVGLMLVTFCSLRLVFGWSTPLAELSPWYYSAILVPAVDTFIGLDVISGVARFCTGDKRHVFPKVA
mmetsp:Transcript_867/g.2705  ORF Transcript_867/g.2705 Transcript_867/m.2705 type:complete len:143 (+) Transcript_867:71-499(+)